MKKIIFSLLLLFSLIFAQAAFCAQNEAPLSAAEIERNNHGFKQLAAGHGELYLGAGTTGDTLIFIEREFHPNTFLQNESYVVGEGSLLFIDEDSIYEAEIDQNKYWVANVYVIRTRSGYEKLVTYRINKKAPQYSVAMVDGRVHIEFVFSGWNEISTNKLVPNYVYNYLTGKTPKSKEAKSSSSASSHSGGNTGKYLKYGAIIFAVIVVIAGAIVLIIRRR